MHIRQPIRHSTHSTRVDQLSEEQNSWSRCIQWLEMDHQCRQRVWYTTSHTVPSQFTQCMCTSWPDIQISVLEQIHVLLAGRGSWGRFGTVFWASFPCRCPFGFHICEFITRYAHVTCTHRTVTDNTACHLSIRWRLRLPSGGWGWVCWGWEHRPAGLCILISRVSPKPDQARASKQQHSWPWRVLWHLSDLQNWDR